MLIELPLADGSYNPRLATWPPNMSDPGHKYDVFISYARKDGLHRAERLERDLVAAGFSTWRDRRNLDPTKDFTAELEHAIEQSARVVCCITPDTKRAESFVRREIAYALAVKTPVITLIFDNTIPQIHIVNVTREDFTRASWEDAVDALLNRLRQREDAEAQLLTPPEDVYREFLNALYKNIADALHQTVFSEITLHSKSIPDAVKIVATVLPAAFWGVRGTTPARPAGDRTSFEDFRQAFEQHEGRILLLGDPGAGKTTTLLAFARDRVAERLHSPDTPLPLLASIATWNPEIQTPLPDWLASQYPMLDRDALSVLLDNGEVLTMRDGLDELGNARRDEETNERYDPRLRFLNLLPFKGQIIVTCRTQAYAEIGHRIELNGAVGLSPLNNAQLRSYLTEMPALRDALEADPQLLDVARTPLLLGILTNAYKENEAELYQLRNLRAAPGELRDRIFRTYVQRRFEHEERRWTTKLKFGINETYEALGRAAVDGMSVSLGHGAIRTIIQKETIAIDESLRLSLGDRAGSFADQARQLHFLIADREQGLMFRDMLIRDHFGFPYGLRCVNKLALGWEHQTLFGGHSNF